jgi:murein DD-endopeptidase MepM/ murein hydrolase activator NlpD
MPDFRHGACPFRHSVGYEDASVDSLAAPAVEPARTLASAGNRPRRPGRQQFSLLIVRGDGTRVLRFNFPRPAALAAFATAAVAATTFCALLGDWFQLRQLTVEARTFKSQIAEQQATIDSFNNRVVELRAEMTGWRDLHARIWEPFGPELQPGGRDRAVGGGALRVDRVTGKLSPRDELERLAEAVSEQGDSLKALDRLVAKAGKALAALPSRWPIRGAVNSEFGMRQSPWTSGTEFHSGLDIRAQHGTPIRAPAGGVVTIAGTYQEYGITVILDHGQDIKSVYGHLSKTNVKIGERVDRGTVVGWSGNTGRSTGAHLHYEILVKGQSVNPRAYLWD